MSRSAQVLFAPFSIKGVTLANRIVMAPMTRSFSPGGVPGEDVAAYIASVPAGRIGTPADIAAAVAFFASDEAGFITGQRLVVDGGRALG